MGGGGCMVGGSSPWPIKEGVIRDVNIIDQ